MKTTPFTIPGLYYYPPFTGKKLKLRNQITSVLFSQFQSVLKPKIPQFFMINV